MTGHIDWGQRAAERGYTSIDEMLLTLMSQHAKAADVARELGVTNATLTTLLRRRGWKNAGSRQHPHWVAPTGETIGKPEPESQPDASIEARLNPLSQAVLVVDFARNVMCEGHLLLGREQPLPRTDSAYRALAQEYAQVLVKEVLW